MGSRRVKTKNGLIQGEELNELHSLRLVLLPISLLTIPYPPTLLCYHALRNQQMGTQVPPVPVIINLSLFGLLCCKIQEGIKQSSGCFHFKGKGTSNFLLELQHGVVAWLFLHFHQYFICNIRKEQVILMLYFYSALLFAQ